MSVGDRATISVHSLSPFGERVGVRGLQNHREAIAPHPTPLTMGEGAHRACCPLMIKPHDASKIKFAQSRDLAAAAGINRKSDTSP
jgi:hypothetical protein